MWFDYNKIGEIENEISELYKEIPFNTRCVKVVYSPCFQSLFCKDRAKNLFSKKYKVYTVNEILDNKKNVKSEKLLVKLLKKILGTLLGFIPFAGTYITITNMFFDISKEIIDSTKSNEIQGYLNNHWKKHKRYNKIKYIIYVDNTSNLSKNEYNYLQIISYLITNKYLSNVALLLCEPNNCPTPYFDNCTVVKEYNAFNIFSKSIDYESKTAQNALTILNIIGINNITKLEHALSQDNSSDATIDAIINILFKEKNLDQSIELEAFLNACSLLFEEFELVDVEYISSLQNNSEYNQLFDIARDAHIIEEINLQKFYFLQPFLRQYYQQRNHTFPSNFYNDLYEYLKAKYPEYYEDLAIASSLLLSDNNLIISENLLAYYYRSNTLPAYKLKKISDVLKSDSLGSNILRIDELYCNWSDNLEESYLVCSASINQLKTSLITNEAKLAAMSFISRLYYELDLEQTMLIDVGNYYKTLLSQIRIFSTLDIRNYNFALDYIVFATCIEEFSTRNVVQKLVGKIRNIDCTKLNQEKYLKYLRLGNAIYPEAKTEAEQLLSLGYELSKNQKYTHALFAVNYSVSLIEKGLYHEAIKVLDTEIRNGCINETIKMSLKNNHIVAKYLSKQSSKGLIKKILSLCLNTRQSDNCICENNYVSMQILNGKTDFEEEIKICERIKNYNDIYHTFYANHNLIVIYFLKKDVRFFSCIENYETPYLLKYYNPIFSFKIDFLRNNYDKKWNYDELSIKLQEHFESSCLNNTSTFYSMPVLLGLIERWFE